jgi:chitin synthase
MRKFWIHVEMVYQFLNLIFSWFALVRLLVCCSLLIYIYHADTLLYCIFNHIFCLGRPVNLKGIYITNIILNYCYLGLLIMCFILALGNRPQGSEWPYTFAIVGFAFITIYMTVSALVLAFKGLDQLVKDSRAR